MYLETNQRVEVNYFQILVQVYNIDFEEGVKELKEGDVLITSNGKEELKSIKWKCANEQTVYNLKLSKLN